jgi:hypothetical protein
VIPYLIMGFVCGLIAGVGIGAVLATWLHQLPDAALRKKEREK